MTLDATLPTDSTNKVSDLGYYQRETRTEVNSVWTTLAGLGQVTVGSTVALTSGQSVLITGTDVVGVALEVVMLSSSTVEAITNITLGTGGQVKLLRFADSNITLTQNATYLKLNSTGAYADFDADEDDIIALLNIGGVPASGLNGYWLELFRTVRI